MHIILFERLPNRQTQRYLVSADQPGETITQLSAGVEHADDS